MNLPVNQIIQGDALEILKTFPDNSIDTVITDPPYGLSNHSEKLIREVLSKWLNGEEDYVPKTKGFMGKNWDAFVPPPALWKEVYRVMKPGGTILCFAGSRTQDLMAMSLRLAGFEIKDTILWLYGCISDDTEILTDRGFKHLHKLTKYDKIMAYDIENDIYKWEIPERWSVYSVNKHTCYRIRGDQTDQIVSREHRCLVEREGKLIFKQAWELESVERVPILSDDIFNEGKISWKLLFKKLCWKIKELVTTNSSFILGEKDRREQRKMEEILDRENDGREKSFLEGGINLQKAEGAICQSINKICSLSKRVYQYGKKRWVCDGTSFESSPSNWKTFIKRRVCSPHKPQCGRQQIGELNAFQKQQRPQIIRSGEGYKTTLATIEKIEYTGLLFCPTVSTGVFVARRNGKIFITGNSGFPKSTDISKQIDKKFGAKRTVIGKGVSGKTAIWSKDGGMGNFDITEPATPEAKLWDGYGTALKPAYEPIILAIKPNEGSYAENALKWNVAGLNIDEGRISYKGEKPNVGGRGKHTRGEGYGYKPLGENIQANTKGRFPANVILTEECFTYKIKEGLKPDEIKKVKDWLYENA